MIPPRLDDARVTVIGLGYVGLPLAVAFARHFDTVGFDSDAARLAALRAGRDATHEVSDEQLAAAHRLTLTGDLDALGDTDVFIVTVPTPIDAYKIPDLRPLISASETIGQVIRPGTVVIYESTVYPGATEDACLPVIEHAAGLTAGRDFHAGYSPERLNPGDREHGVTDIRKVTAGSTPEVGEFVDALYARVIDAGTYRASSIRVAEAAKVIENTQRDVNIALVNELAMLFDRLGLDTEEILRAAGTKWNFLPFRPGLVGGHCIGVDPYYLTHKAQAVGHHPEMILAGRRLNDGMGAYIASRVVKLMLQRRLQIVDSRILVLGLAFKENTPDLRNTRVIDIIEEFCSYSANVTVHDPYIDAEEAFREYGLRLAGESELEAGTFDAVVLTVGHAPFKAMGVDAIRRYLRPGGVLFDVKYIFAQDEVDGRL